MLCTFECKWVTDNNTDLSEVVLFRSDSPSLNSDTTSQPRAGGVTLRPAAADLPSISPPTIHVKALSGLSLEAIDVLCDARHVEVLSIASGEYLTTQRGERVDDVMDSPRRLYMIQNSFEEPVGGCSLRFASLDTPSALWIHSIHVTLAESVRSPSSMSTLEGGLAELNGQKIDMDRVKMRLADCGVVVPANAQQLFSALEVNHKERELQRKQINAVLPDSLKEVFKQLSAVTLNDKQPTHSCEDSVAPANHQVFSNDLSSALPQTLLDLYSQFLERKRNSATPTLDQVMLSNNRTASDVNNGGKFDGTVNAGTRSMLSDVGVDSFVDGLLCGMKNNGTNERAADRLLGYDGGFEARFMARIADMETRLFERIELVEQRLNVRLDEIMLRVNGEEEGKVDEGGRVVCTGQNESVLGGGCVHAENHSVSVRENGVFCNYGVRETLNAELCLD